MSQDLIEYLRARLDEERTELEELTDGSTFPASIWYVPDSESARECLAIETPGPKDYRRWWPPTESQPSASDWGWLVHQSGRCVFSVEKARQALADIEAKRRIVARFVALLDYAARPYDKPEHAAKRQPYLNALEDVLRDLVQPYSGRSDFNPDWRTP